MTLGILKAKLFPHLDIRDFICRHMIVDTMSIQQSPSTGQSQSDKRPTHDRKLGTRVVLPPSDYHSMMSGAVLNRVRAAVMAACFLCAGIIFPDLDAALFHGITQEDSRPHVETTGSAACHAESCVLGAVLPQGQKSSTVKADLERLLEAAALSLPSIVSISDRTPTGSPDSRAPPAVSVS